MDPKDAQPSEPVESNETPTQPSAPTTPNTPSMVTPSATPGGGVSNNTPVAGSAPVASTGSGKKLFGKIGIIPAAIVGAVVLLGATSAAYFGFVLPNQPANIWKTALSNTSKGYDELVEYIDEQKDVKGGKVKGNFKFESSDVVVDGNIDGAYDDKSSNIKLDAGAAGTRVNFTVLTNIPEGATTPDIYLKAEGLAGVGELLGGGDPAAAQYFAELDGKFYFIDHTLIDQAAKSAQQSDSSFPDLKAEDVKAIAEAVGNVNKDYLFTTDESKAVFKVKSEVGKETVDGRETYHYKVGYDKEHLKEYMTKLKEALKQTKLKDLITDESFDQSIRDIDQLDGNGEADVWVDMKTKLIRTIRFTDTKDNTTLDIGLLHEGGDDFPFYLTVKDKEANMTIKLNLNTKTNVVTLDVNGDFSQEGQSSKATAKLTLEPSNDTVDFQKPEGAESLSDLIAPFLGGGLGASGGLDQGGAEFSEDDFDSFSTE